MASWSDVLRLLPQLAVNLLPGLVSSRIGMGGRVMRSLERGAQKRVPGAAFTYPKLSGEFNYPIVYVGGDVPYMNASLNRGASENSSRAQTLEEHNRALAAGGIAAERALESWWPNQDTQPRVPFTPGSSAISGVKILPNNKIQVQFRGGGKWYTYKGGSNPLEASLAAKTLLESPSIGRALSARNGKKGIINPNLGYWARNHYDPSEVR